MKLLLRLLLCLSLTGAVHAAFPEKPIRIIVPYAAGGGADSTSRLLAQKMSEHLGQPVIVDNRPGANAVIGTSAIAKAEPDGYNIGMVISAHAINAFVVKNLPYDPLKDFEPIAYVARMPGVLLVNPSFPAATLPELVALAKRQPAQLFYAIAGGLTNGHVSMELLKVTAGIDVTPVTFKGGAPASMEVVSGRVQMMIVAPPAAMPFIQTGKLRAVATTGATRLKQLDKVPTFKESGYADFETYEWFGILAPARTPKAVIDRLSESISLALKDPAVAARLATMGLEVVNGGPRELKTMLDGEMGKMKSLTQAVKFESE
jgi:tripartite-type tricarboxylate transporter receptor subunit TctC